MPFGAVLCAEAVTFRVTCGSPAICVARALVRQEGGGDRADRVGCDEGAELARVGYVSDRGALELPLRTHRLHSGEHLRTHDRDHPLLRLGDHDLPRLEVRLAQRYAVEVHVDARAVPRHLREGGREPRRAAILEGLDEAALDELERGFDQLLPRERIPDLHRRPLVRIVLS